MRTVIYDPEDMEPLTVFDVPDCFVREIEAGKRGRYLRFAIMEPPKTSPFDYSPRFFEPMKVAEIKFERMQYRDRTTWLVLAMNPEICLLLKSELLPGQRKDANQREKLAMRDGFFQGFMAAMNL